MSALSVNTTATDPDIEGMRLRWVLIWYLAVLPALWVLPPIVKCCRRRLRSRRSATEHSPTTDVANAVTSVTAAQLEAAEQARKRLQLRVKGALWQVGYMFTTYGLTPVIGVGIVRRGAPAYLDPTPIVRSYIFHIWAMHWGFGMMLLSVQPSEAARVRSVVKCSTAIASFGGLFSTSSIFTFYNAGRTEYAIVCLLIVCGCAFWAGSSIHSLYAHHCFRSEPVPPRRQLQRLWFSLRLFYLTFGFGIFFTGIFRWLCSGSECDVPPFDPTFAGINGLLCLFVSAPAIRGRIYRTLGSLGKSGPAEQQAASVASLLGDTSVVKALDTATSLFRAQPVSTITRAALINNEPDPSLHTLTVPAKLGAVDAFMSHSWCTLRRGRTNARR